MATQTSFAITAEHCNEAGTLIIIPGELTICIHSIGDGRSSDPGQRLQALHKQHSELRSSVSAALAKLDGTEESQQIHREVITKLTELTNLRAQHAELRTVHSALTVKYKEKKGKALQTHSLCNCMASSCQEFTHGDLWLRMNATFLQRTGRAG